MDLWGHCTTCDRWFSMAGDVKDCPVCQGEPAIVVDRDENPSLDPA